MGTKFNNHIPKLINNYSPIILLLIIGFLFRIYLLSVAYNDPRYDIRSYSELTQDLLSGNLAVNCCYKNSGYAFFLAPIYYFFGFMNFKAVGWFQIFMDLGSSLFLFGITRKIFSRNTALVAVALYVANPVAASYTGLVLPETLTIFILLLTGYIILEPKFTRTPILWALTGFCLGLLVFIRLQFFFFCIVFPLTLVFLQFRKLNKLFFIFVFSLGFFIASSYSFYSYYITYGRISIGPPYVSPSLALYNLYYRKGPYPEIAEDWAREPYDKEAFEGYMDLSKTPFEKFSEFNSRYTLLAQKNLMANPTRYLINYVKSIYWIWNKTHLFYYEDHIYTIDSLIVWVTNAILLLLWSAGIAGYIFMYKFKAIRNPLVTYSLLLFLYATFYFPLASAESRHTVFYSGFLALWASFGLRIIKNKLKMKNTAFFDRH